MFEWTDERSNGWTRHHWFIETHRHRLCVCLHVDSACLDWNLEYIYLKWKWKNRSKNNNRAWMIIIIIYLCLRNRRNNKYGCLIEWSASNLFAGKTRWERSSRCTFAQQQLLEMKWKSFCIFCWFSISWFIRQPNEKQIRCFFFVFLLRAEYIDAIRCGN